MSSGKTLSCYGDPTQAYYLGTSGEETRGTLTNKVQEFGDRVRDKFGPSH
jgi:hypothetical protein